MKGDGRLGAASVRAEDVDLARGRVPEIQRARILAALVELTRERNATQITVAHVVTRAGVSRRTFYEFFADRDACFLAAFQDAVQRAAACAEPAFNAPGSWRKRIRAGLAELLVFLEQDPGLAGLCIVDVLSAGPVVLQYRARVMEVLVEAVDQGRREARAGAGLTRLTAEGVVGGVLSVIYARLTGATPAGEPERGLALSRLLSPLVALIVLPYLGHAAAAREARRPAPRAHARAPRARSNPLEGLDMRLTYRTIRVLVTIGQMSDASNRQVAASAGIHDQGQISKLLARLEDLGLIANDGGRNPGAANAWRLTPRGHEVQQTIQPQTTPAAR